MNRNWDLETIRNYIVKKYPESCFALNKETEHEDCIGFFYYEKLKWCGCGRPEDALEAVRKLLKCHENFDDREERFKQNFGEGVKSVYDNELLLCLAYTLDAAGLTEHGGGIGGAWLTDEGEMLLWLLENKPDLEVSE